MMSEYEMTDLGAMKYFLGMQVKQSPGKIFLSQEKYADDLLKKFNMSECKPLATPMALNEKLSKNDGKEKVDASIYRSLVGSLIYLIHTRPDIAHTVSVVSRFMILYDTLHGTGGPEPSVRYHSGRARILTLCQDLRAKGQSQVDSFYGA
ncbi:hypothetical protein BVRB_8g187060 [Beta vulgaris subsp. vulgaris]|nr:hypothetical protein BVRB_8g187060 [Beta vulgaris subsp. vulgaris]